MSREPVPAVLEVIDSGVTTGDRGLMPTEVRLNGVPLAVAEGTPIVLHEVVVKPGQLVTATLTLTVSALHIRPAEPPTARRSRSLPVLG